MQQALLSWSSGKDSAWALHELRRSRELALVGLVTTVNEAFGRVAMHGVREALLERQAAAAGVPLWKVPLPHPCPNEVYEARMAGLIERARARNAQKRWGEKARITLDEGLLGGAEQSVDLLALDEALERLAALDPEQARIIELRFFGGLTVEETADAMSVSPATVKRHWTVARAWLARELESRPDP